MSQSSRRHFTQTVLGGALGFLTTPDLWPQAREVSEPAKAHVRALDLSLLHHWQTPNELFFIHDHFPAPALSKEAWRLGIVGAVDNPYQINFRDLLTQPKRDLAATLECARNPVGGGMLGTARWAGASLGALIEKAAPKVEAKLVRLWGADQNPKTQGHFYQTLPLEKAVHFDTLLAYEMNGAKLPAAHGGPARAIVPGWYGMDSVKWLIRVELIPAQQAAAPLDEPYTRRVLSPKGGMVSFTPVAEIQVKSVFSRPLDGAILEGRRFTVRGAAWAGERRVAKVEVSTDGAKSWRGAKLLPSEAHQESSSPYGWLFWEYPWEIPGAGQYELVVRATDEAGHTQPAVRPAGRLDENELNHYHRVRCRAV